MSGRGSLISLNSYILIHISSLVKEIIKMESSGHQIAHEIANSKESPRSDEQQRQSMLLQLDQLQEQEQHFHQASRVLNNNNIARRTLKSSSSAYSAWAQAQAVGSAYCTNSDLKIFASPKKKGDHFPLTILFLAFQCW